MKVSIKNCHIEVVLGDISALPKAVDALVSSDDNYLSAGGGVSLALLEAAADESVRAEMDQHVGGKQDGQQESLLKAGDAVVTSAGSLGEIPHSCCLSRFRPSFAWDRRDPSDRGDRGASHYKLFGNRHRIGIDKYRLPNDRFRPWRPQLCRISSRNLRRHQRLSDQQ